MYTIRDTVAEESFPPFCAKNDGVALRSFEQNLAKQATHPSEFRILMLGTFDTDTTLLEPLERPLDITPVPKE
jgi:hypothetical protein